MKDAKTQSQITYDKLAPNYRKVSEEKQDYLKTIDNLIVTILGKADSIVDLGSGDGVHISKLANSLQVKKVLLVDNSDEMLILSRKIPKIKAVKSSIVDINSSDRFDVVTCLWNVLGHVEPYDNIRKTLVNIDQNLLKNGGWFFLDVNNIYNAKSYGTFQVIQNIVKDILKSAYSAYYKEEYIKFKKLVSGEDVEMKVHFFGPMEVEGYLKGTRLRVFRKYYINYNSGDIEKCFWRGQIFYVIKKYD
ncbi:class I SAM-dependent methyltransferase [Patescibacteria group bacterium]|nr:class I SAM-dependent methyltransferase [Patescibacteria group bacterium]MBU1256789.1 class I SAM-dependent methyltransferase [Patescibacteria group bacterium]MBU1457641.1 class I SAM-dependent methyltransferase [Patescibacteria group bacterium]